MYIKKLRSNMLVKKTNILNTRLNCINDCNINYESQYGIPTQPAHAM